MKPGSGWLFIFMVIAGATLVSMGGGKAPATVSANAPVNAMDPPASCHHDAHTFRCVKYLRNHDGDTLTFDIPGVHALLGSKISVRVRGIDSPETSGNKPCERERAREAKQRVESALARARSIELRDIGRDKYFRILADVYVDGRSLGQDLLAERLAYAYDGGRKPASLSWCR